jgi:thiol:disulfide interchange protein DsbD
VRLAAIAVVAVAYKSLVTFEKAVEIKAAPETRELAAGGKNYEPVVRDGKIAWTPYDGARLKKENGRNRPVFMDFTAEWCASCKANERAFLETDTVRTALEKTGIMPMKADMTNENEELNGVLDKLGRNGIPVYVIWFPDGSYDLLPITITAEMVASHLEDAAKKYPVDKFAMK